MLLDNVLQLFACCKHSKRLTTVAALQCPVLTLDLTRHLHMIARCSAGFAIADVNYGGSTGYGREYRNRLRRNWGIVDVADCSNAAKHLAKQGKADEKRLCIDGGSAGGYTTLACLAFRSHLLLLFLCLMCQGESV